MTKLLIADDEMLVLVGLKSMINWSSMGIEITGTAHNGAQALEMIESLKPDIVLIDINMPVKNGLEVAHESREKYGKLPVFIFLTSYEEFSFAREAVSVQALDYLVKISLTPEVLEKAMKKALCIVQELKSAVSDTQNTPDRKDTLALLRDRFFLRLFNNEIESPAQLREQAGELGISLDSAQFAVIICETAARAGATLTKDSLVRLYTSTIQTAVETVTKYFPCYVTGLDMKHFAIMLMLPAMEYGQYRTTAEKIMTKLQEIVFSYFSVDLYCCAGIPVSASSDIFISYRSATQTGTGGKTPVKFAPEEEKTPYRDRILTQLQDYIRKNITKRLSLNDVAEEFGFTPNYVSQMFAKSGKSGFVEYVTAEKISAAKKMLESDSNLLVYELADRLGFESAFYFSTVFKKTEGCSPSEYRERLTSKQQ